MSPGSVVLAVIAAAAAARAVSAPVIRFSETVRTVAPLQDRSQGREPFTAPVFAAWLGATAEDLSGAPGCGTEIRRLEITYSDLWGDGSTLWALSTPVSESFYWDGRACERCRFPVLEQAAGSEVAKVIPGPGATVVMGLGLLLAAGRSRHRTTVKIRPATPRLVLLPSLSR
jgi:hypothetical protein